MIYVGAESTYYREKAQIRTLSYVLREKNNFSKNTGNFYKAFSFPFMGKI